MRFFDTCENRFAIALLSGLTFMAVGCAIQKPALQTSAGEISGSIRLPLPPGPVALKSDHIEPAAYSFQKAKGKLGSAKQEISDAALMAASAPGVSVITITELEADSWQEAAFAGAVGGAAAFVASPFVGTAGVIRSLKTVKPSELAEREAVLITALSEMADQRHFRKSLLEAGAQLFSEHRIVETNNNAQTINAAMEAHVENLRLEPRPGGGEDSYFLRIQTHTRILRVPDGEVLRDEVAEFRSGESLFLDWTMHRALEGVAETGYRALAQHTIQRLLGDNVAAKQR